MWGGRVSVVPESSISPKLPGIAGYWFSGFFRHLSRALASIRTKSSTYLTFSSRHLLQRKKEQ